MKIVDLKTDNRKDNNNVGCAIPVFGWRAEGTERNIRQKSYRLQVWKTESPEEILAEPFPVWDSGTVCSSSMANIPYEGKHWIPAAVIGGRWNALWIMRMEKKCL